MENEKNPVQQTPEEKNLSYLEKQLEFLGFGDEVKDLLQTEIAKNADSENFTVAVTQSFSTPLSGKETPDSRNTANYELNFNRDKRENIENRYFYLNNYSAAKGKNQMKVYVSSEQKNITAKEAFNLLEGRSVYKKELVKMDGDKYNAWINFDFKKLNEKNQPEIHRYTDRYGFDISGGLKKLPLKENLHEDRHNQLIASLEKGNLQAVTVIAGDREKQLFLEANPQYKNFNLYEVTEKNRLAPVKAETLVENTQQATEKEEKRPGMKM